MTSITHADLKIDISSEITYKDGRTEKGPHNTKFSTTVHSLEAIQSIAPAIEVINRMTNRWKHNTFTQNLWHDLKLAFSRTDGSDGDWVMHITYFVNVSGKKYFDDGTVEPISDYEEIKRNV